MLAGEKSKIHLFRKNWLHKYFWLWEHLWPSHQILRDKLSLKGENVASSHSGSNTGLGYAHLVFLVHKENS